MGFFHQFWTFLTSWIGGPDRANFQLQFEEWRQMIGQWKADLNECRTEREAMEQRHDETTKKLMRHIVYLRKRVSELETELNLLKAPK